VVAFIVEKDGSLSDVRIANSVHPLLDAEAIRVVSSMPKWNPGLENGNPVRVKYVLPVTFSLKEK
jgi:protein TonB